MLRNIFMLPGPRIEDVFAFVLDKPPNGSTFFKDCLVELRDQNTSADFISFFEDLLPYIQTRQSIVLYSEFIFSKLVSELQMEARFSLDPILRLIAALSRDLKDDFAPFLPRVVNSLVVLLNNGGQKDAETIEQIFTSWSEIIENLRFCFSRDIQGALSDIINEKISRSMSCALDLARPSQLEKGIKMMLFEVAEQPERAARAGFLHYDMIVRLQKS
ncbi:PREDICTED: uncharacterized protein LOC106320775 [Brassica oleracea var. oleracea]|uniref:uncharacterized protein LOC106320775 n=1 Tax=Brassica oleracea var. oleracea TaxID=109376 RepID=UPI0006A703A2|nr:PREDICTED: uncharacterized protein LOC106320775 [Brassica oleracea var. oleracea]